MANAEAKVYYSALFLTAKAKYLVLPRCVSFCLLPDHFRGGRTEYAGPNQLNGCHLTLPHYVNWVRAGKAWFHLPCLQSTSGWETR